MRPPTFLALLAVMAVVTPLRAGDGAELAVVRSRQAEAHAEAAWGAGIYGREVDAWVREADAAGVPIHVVDDAELAGGRSTFDAVVVPFPDFDDPRANLRLQALVEQARRVLVVGGAARPSAAIERLRVACGAPAFHVVVGSRSRRAVLKGRSFVAAEVAPGAVIDLRVGVPLFAASSSRALGWYAEADLAPADAVRDPEGGAAIVTFSCGGAEVVWSGVPVSALVREGERAPQAQALVANLTSWLAGRPWLGRAPWHDDRTLAVVLAVEVGEPLAAVQALVPVLQAARVRGTFRVGARAGAGADLQPLLARVGDVEALAAAEPLPPTPRGVRDDCQVPGAVPSLLADDVALHERLGALYVLELHPTCLLLADRLPLVASFLAAAKQRPAWFATRRQVADWLRARAAVVVRRVEGGFQVTNTGAVALPAFPLVSYRFGPDDLAQLGRRGLFLPRDDGGTTFVLDLAPGETLTLPVSGR